VARARSTTTLDGPAADALETASLAARRRGGREVKPFKWLERLRDRVVHRSQVGKRKLDRTAARRELDHASRELGERYRALVKMGRAEVPGELALFMEAVRAVEERLAALDKEIAALEDERPSGST
jgi:hypothetical protein